MPYVAELIKYIRVRIYETAYLVRQPTLSSITSAFTCLQAPAKLAWRPQFAFDRIDRRLPGHACSSTMSPSATQCSCPT